MIITLGVDTEGSSVHVEDLLERLKFPDVDLELVHAVEMYVPFDFMAGVEPIFEEEYLDSLRELANTRLADATRKTSQWARSVKQVTQVGSPAKVLVTESEARSADLVAVCTRSRSAIEIGFLGSVSRALAISCTQPILVGKDGFTSRHEDLKAVFATDHSAFSQQAIKRFLKYPPAGIKSITILSAYTLSESDARIMSKSMPMLGGKVENWIVETIQKSCSVVASQLRDAGYEVDIKIVANRPNEAIHLCMKETAADLLIMGAQGKGYLERVLIGSVALHQVGNEAYPVMIIRP